MISVIVPVFNEEKSLTELYQRIKKVLPKDGEIVFVDDGSTDNSSLKMARIAKKDKQVSFLRLKHSGKANALMDGFKKTKGEIVITLDADLQDAPEEIPKFLKKINEGYDLVSGWKRQRKDNFAVVFFSRILNFFVSRMTPLKIHDVNCGFKAYKKDVLKNLNLYGDLYRFIPILAVNDGFRVGEVEVRHAPRKYGRSKYGLLKGFRGLFDLLTILFLTKFKTRPFHFFGPLGCFLFLAGFLISLYLTILWFQGESIGRRPLLILGILLIIIGIQIFSTGLVAELIVSIFHEKRKPNK
ncbi:glycosyltransferase family 2 protein [Candidatus Shapirobacteria bacterium]|nr:glycosyltransferase family 2 protein [Candidatus Shapirobacteria bacterium]